MNNPYSSIRSHTKLSLELQVNWELWIVSPVSGHLTPCATKKLILSGFTHREKSILLAKSTI